MQFDATLFYKFKEYPLLLERLNYYKYYDYADFTYNDLLRIITNTCPKNEHKDIINIYNDSILFYLSNKYTTVAQYDIFGKLHTREVPSKTNLRQLLLEYLYFFNGLEIDVTSIYNLFQSVFNIKIMTRSEIKDFLKTIPEIKCIDNTFYSLKDFDSFKENNDIINTNNYSVNKFNFSKNTFDSIISEIHPENFDYIYNSKKIKDYIQENADDNIFLFFFLRYSLKQIASLQFTNLFYEDIDNKTEKEIRNFNILLKRNESKTLSEIGEEIGLAKERIRQIIDEYILSFNDLCKRANNFFLKIFKGYSKNGMLITHDEIKAIIEPDLYNLFIFFLEKTDLEGLSYYPEIEGFVFGDFSWFAIIEDIIDKSPNAIDSQEFKKLTTDIILKLKRKNIDVSYDVISKKLSTVYQKSGTIYKKTNLSQSKKYWIVIEKEFPNGFHVHNEEQMKIFRNKYYEIFKETLDSKTDRSIEGRIEDTCIIIDRGLYKPYNGEVISQDLANKIESYIDNSEYKTYSLNSLFLIFKSELENENILNRYYFHSLLKKTFIDKYYYTRDYLLKEKNSTILEEVLAMIQKNNGKINLKTIQEEIPGMTQIMFSSFMDKLNMISLFNCEYLSTDYINESNLNISLLKEEIDTYLLQYNFIDSKKLFELVSVSQPLFIKDNNLTPYSLFGITKFYFKNSYFFKRPFISKDQFNLIESKDQIVSFIKDFKEVTISELKQYINENDIFVPDLEKLISDLPSNISRKDETLYFS